MQECPPQYLESLDEIIQLSSEPTRILLELLYRSGDTQMHLSDIATLIEALQVANSARIDAAFQTVNKQIGVIKLDGTPEPDTHPYGVPRVTAILEKPNKNEAKQSE